MHASNDYLTNLTMREVSCQGGNEKCHNLNDTAAYNAWADSVKVQPWIVDARYTHNAMLVQDTSASALLTDVTKAYMAWKGLEHFITLVEAARAELLKLMAIPTPTCNKTWPCQRVGKTGDPRDLIPAMKTKAGALYNNTDILHQQLTAAHANLTVDARITGWESNITAWTQAVKELLADVFSQPMVLTVGAAMHGFCPFFCSATSVCCWMPDITYVCPDCSGQSSCRIGTVPAACTYTSPPIPSRLL